MLRSLETQSPAPAGMYRNGNYDAEMAAYPAAKARYAQEMAEYNTSCARKTAYQLGYASGILACLGAAGSPFAFFAGSLIGGSAAGGSFAAALVSWAFCKCSNHPKEPKPPELFSRETATPGSGGG